jgi:hypothetical protein
VAYAVLANLTVFLHFAFIVFVIGGGFLVRFWPRLVWAHLAAAAWGAYVALANKICPLTPLEKWLSRQAGGAGYDGGFMERYLFWLIYPSGLTHDVQRLLGVGVIVLNVAVYAWIWSRRRSATASKPAV